ncbi:MAG: hypothetical protein KDA22_11530 [Phycisphaerales bacterium]|nr:hypothetical protein [Phycisphaerales bacterium]
MLGTQFVLLFSLASGLPGDADSFDLSWHTVDGGGGLSAGGNFSITGTIGQADAHASMAGDGYSLAGGFWAGAGSTPGSPCSPDLNGDGMVDGADLGLLLAAWNGTGIADLDQSGSVDGADLGLLLGSWGPCPE